MKPVITWIVIADGAQAKIFTHRGPGTGLTALPDLEMSQEPLRARDIMADKPGRSISSAGPGSRAAMEYHTDPVEVRERRFVAELAEMLERKYAEGAFERLIIAAAPNALGDLRPALSERLRAATVAELPKDLINVPTPKLAAHFEGVMAV